MLLGELVRVLSPAGAYPVSEVEIKGIACDSRRVEPGDLFVALRGTRFDGSEFIPQAVSAGAAAVVAEGFPDGERAGLPGQIPVLVVSDSRQALARLAAEFYGHPSRGLKLVGVTGTNGKTTTAFLLDAIFRAGGRSSGLIGTVLVRIGEQESRADMTTPESLDLQRILARMREAGVTHAAMEVSSHALAQGRVDGCAFTAAVFTNLTRDHLDFHGDFGNYLAAKIRLFEMVGTSFETDMGEGAGVINADDPAAPEVIARCRGRVVTYGIRQPADLAAEGVRITPRGNSFRARTPWGSYDLEMRLPGYFNVYNALGAFGAAVMAGIDPAAAAEGLAAAGSIPGRCEPVDEGQDFTVLVDYAHTPDGLRNILETARRFTQRRLIAVFGCGGDRDRTKRPEMGRIGSELADYLVLTSDNPRSEDPEAILREIAAGLDAGSRHAVIPDRREAIRHALKVAGPGDSVVIAGKGHETYQLIGGRAYPFDDRQAARELLHSLGKGRKR